MGTSARMSKRKRIRVSAGAVNNLRATMQILAWLHELIAERRYSLGGGVKLFKIREALNNALKAATAVEKEAERNPRKEKDESASSVDIGNSMAGASNDTLRREVIGETPSAILLGMSKREQLNVSVETVKDFAADMKILSDIHAVLEERNYALTESNLLAIRHALTETLKDLGAVEKEAEYNTRKDKLEDVSDVNMVGSSMLGAWLAIVLREIFPSK